MRLAIRAVRGIDAETGRFLADTKRYVDALKIDAERKSAILEGDTRRLFQRIA